VVAYTTAGAEAAISTLTSRSPARTGGVPLCRSAGPKLRPPSLDGSSEAPAVGGHARASTDEGFDGLMKRPPRSPEIDPVARVQCTGPSCSRAHRYARRLPRRSTRLGR